jgi:hypothetical protein
VKDLGSMKGQGLGKDLLFHAIDKVTKIAKEIGIRAIVVDAKNASAEAFLSKIWLRTSNYDGRSLFS